MNWQLLNPFSGYSNSRKSRRHLESARKCRDVVSVINDVLITEFEIPDDKVRWYYEPTDVVNHCTRTIEYPGLYYTVSGGYGFETYLPDDDYERLYDNKAGTSDLDIKIVFDTKYKSSFLGFFNEETDNPDVLEKADQTPEFMLYLMDQIRQKLREQGETSKDGGEAIFIPGLGLLWSHIELKLDVLISSLEHIPSLSAYLNTDRVTYRSWKPGFRIFDALHMFLLCFYLGYSLPPGCVDFTNRITKLRKIIVRACIVSGVDYSDIDNSPRTRNTDAILKTFEVKTKLLYSIMERPEFKYKEYFRAITSMLETEFDTQSGGDSSSLITPPSSCYLAIHPRTLYLLFGSEALSDLRGEDEEVEVPDAHAGGGSNSNNVALSVMGFCVTVVAAAVSSLSPHG
jgi:hypothetical protein